MSQSDQYKIVSEDYVSLMIKDYKTNPLAKQKVELLNVIDEQYAVGYIPVEEVANDSINKFGYSSFPFAYTITTTIDNGMLNGLENRTLPNLGLGGDRVLIGIVDTGIDYTHPAFLNPDGTTKIVSIWDQTINDVECSNNYKYGCIYSKDEINEALASENPFSIVPTSDRIGQGTMLAGVACGSRNESNEFEGIASKAELVVVKLKPAKNSLKQYYFIPEDKICYQEDDIMLGVKYLLSVAKETNSPMSICIALGTNQGGHAGLGKLSDLLSNNSLRTGISISIAGGNEGNGRNHYSGSIDSSIGYNLVELMVGESQPSFYMEVWGEPGSRLIIDVTTPNGEEFTTISPDLFDSRRLNFQNDTTTVWLNNIRFETDTRDELIVFRFETPTQGIWKFKVYSEIGRVADFNIWLPVRYFLPEDTYFLKPDSNITIVSPGNSIMPITVSAYDEQSGNIYDDSSRGFTRINIIKPDFSAPGVGIETPFLENSYVKGYGTGIAASYTAGISALFLEWGIVSENLISMSTINIKNFLIQNADRNEILEYPNNIWGFGAINVDNTFDINP